MSEETQQVKRNDMINVQNKTSEEQQTDTGEELPKNPDDIEIINNDLKLLLTL